MYFVFYFVASLVTVGASGRYNNNTTKVSGNEDDKDEGGMRRACSLSDLSVGPSNRLLNGPKQGIFCLLIFL